MAGLLFGGKSQTIRTEEPRLNAVRIQSSAYGMALPVLWGTARLSGNLIWYGDFTAIPHVEVTTSGGGGKGGGGGGVRTEHTTYTYTVAAAMGLCEGEIAGILNVWSAKEQKALGDLGFALFTGTLTQSPWSWLTSKHPAEALSYPGFAYVAVSALDLGGQASLPLLSFEVKGKRVYGYGVLDAQPKEVVADLLIDAVVGAGWPSANIASLDGYRDYCAANAFFISPALVEQRDAASILSDILMATNSAPVWSEGKLKVIPFGDAAASSAYGSWTPSLVAQYDLTDDDFLHASGEDPVQIQRKTSADAYNHVQVEYTDRANEYNPGVAEAKDQANIELYGLRPARPVKLDCICETAMAARIADILLRRSLYVRSQYQFRLGWKYARLEPMDIVTLTDTALGLIQLPVRILAIEEDTDGSLRITAEELLVGVSSAAPVNPQAGGGYSVDFNVAPGNANAPVIFEPPLSLAGAPQIWLATSGSSLWGGAEIYVSRDDATYTLVGTTRGPCRHGVTTATLPSGADPDVTNTLKVDLTVSGGALVGGTLQDRDFYTTLSYVGGELVSYQNAALTGPNAYDLTSLRRGAYGTAVVSHSTAAAFARLDDAVFKYAYDPEWVGQTLYIKLRSFNIYGGGLQDLSALTPHVYALAGAPLGSVGGLQLEQPFIGTNCRIMWTPYPGAQSYKVEVYVGAALKRTVVNLAAPRYDYSFEDAIADGGPYRNPEFRVYAINATGESSAAAVLATANPQVAAPSGLSVMQGTTSLTVTAAKSADSDYLGTLVWMSDTPGFTPGAGNLVYQGPDNFYTAIGLTGGGTKYFRVAHYDVFGADSLNLSSEISGTPTSAGGGGVEVVGSLPTTGNFEGRVVYLTTDEKLYRYDGAAWVSWVDGSDILAASITAGKISVSSLAAISANLGTITAGNMTLDAAGFIRGGASDYANGNGFWMGYHSTTYKFFIGNSAGNYMTWDGSALNIIGNLNGGSIAIGGGKFAVDSSGNVTIKSAASGARLEIYNNVIKVFDSAGTLRVKLGDLAA